jgi:selT/selW/selH-like putative selenoprotein
LAAAIKKKLNLDVELMTGRRGSFEVTKDGKTVFSRLETGVFPSSEDAVLARLEAA